MSKVVDKICLVLKYCVMVLLAAAIIIITMQITFRYAIKSPLTWSEQTARYLFIWMMMLGIPLIFHNNSVFTFDIILKKMKPRLKKATKIFIALVTEFFMVYYFIQSLQLCIKAGSKIVPGLDIPLMWVYVAQPICAVLVFIIVLNQLILLVKRPAIVSQNDE